MSTVIFQREENRFSDNNFESLVLMKKIIIVTMIQKHIKLTTALVYSLQCIGIQEAASSVLI